ncbi:TIGR04255 family protein [Kribbella sp. NPDC020789]
MYERREVFPFAPLALVAAELRFAYSPRLGQRETLDALALALEDELPVVRPVQKTSITFPGGESEVENVYRLFNSDSTLSLSITATAVTLESTKYSEFSSFISILMRAAEQIERLRAVHALERIGLRYIDEIRVPVPIDDARDWRGWVADPLVDLLDVAGKMKATTSQGVVEYDLGDSRRLAFRFAAINGDPVVGTDPLLRDPLPGPGPYFVLDVDAYWQPGRSELSEFISGYIETHLHGLHGPTGAAFQDAITDQARSLFRGN